MPNATIVAIARRRMFGPPAAPLLTMRETTTARQFLRRTAIDLGQPRATVCCRGSRVAVGVRAQLPIPSALARNEAIWSRRTITLGQYARGLIEHPVVMPRS